MKQTDIIKTLQEAYEEGFLDGRHSDYDFNESYSCSDTRTLVNKLIEGDDKDVQ